MLASISTFYPFQLGKGAYGKKRGGKRRAEPYDARAIAGDEWLFCASEPAQKGI